MDAAQLIASLSQEQVAAVYAIRDSILAQHANAEQAFVAVNQQLTADIAAANTAKATAESDLAAKTIQYDAEVAKVTALEAEKATFEATIQKLRSDKADLDTELDTEQQLTAMLQARITALEAIRQFNPRWMTPDSFINRFTAKEAKAFYSSEDAMIVGGQQLLEAYEDAGYYVDLDDTQVQGLTGYMVQIGMLTAERRKQVLRDATAQEAYYAS